MKTRLLWGAVIVVLVALVVAFFFPREAPAPASRTLTPAAAAKQFAPPSLPLPEAPAPVVPPLKPVATALPSPALQPPAVSLPLEVPIQDGATIDFSAGAPAIRSGGADTEALDRALKEMDEATKDMTFPAPAAEKR